MLGRKFFKTKLCKLYQGGRCPRENCSFAHGNADLRHVPGFFNDRADFRSGDLRDKLDRRNSPPRRYSPRRDARGYHEFHRQKPVSRDRGYSRSRSPIKRSERRHKKSHHSEGESDDSGSLKISNATKYKRKEDKISSQDEKDALGEQFKKIQLEINVLRDHKAQLETFLEEKDDEARKFSSKIEDLEMQLEKEQEDYRRITSKIKKFARAHGRYVKAQEDLKRSQARLQRLLGDNLGSDISKPFANEEDSSVNFATDEEANADKQRSPRNYESQITSSIKKRQHVHAATSEEAHIGNKRKKTIGITSRSEKLSRAEGLPHSESDNKESKSKRAVNSKKDALKSWDEYKHKHGKLNHSGGTSLEKVKGSEVGHSLPSTSMAANAIDELIEAIDIEEKSQGKGASAVDGIGAVENKMSLSYVPPPPPPVTQNAYRLFEGDDEDVDVEKVDLENMDVNSEVEIV